MDVVKNTSQYFQILCNVAYVSICIEFNANPFLCKKISRWMISHFIY